MGLKVTKTDRGLLVNYGPGRAKWPNVVHPDMKFAKGKAEKGRYSCNIIVPAEGSEWCQELYDRLKELQQEKYDEVVASKKTKAQKNKVQFANENRFPVQKVVNDDDEETGEWLIKAGCNAGFINKEKEFVGTRPRIYDAKAKKANVDVGGGSLVKVGADASAYEVTNEIGVSLFLGAVQVLEFKQSMNRENPEAWDFEEEEDFDFESASDVEGSENPEGSEDGDF